MFTGIITELGEVVSLNRRPSVSVLSVKAPQAASNAALGDSIAISGVCLTVTAIRGAEVDFDLSGETLSSSTLGALKPGDKVNLEEALRADGKLGGHFVSGHVDSVGRIKSRVQAGDTWEFVIEAPGDVTRYLVDKGSVAVDGISLTVVKILKDGFTLVIIPHTAKLTTLGFKAAGDAVNLEADIIGKYIYRFLHKDGSADADQSLMDALMRGGFA
jgi:riboflavin synthase